MKQSIYRIRTVAGAFAVLLLLTVAASCKENDDKAARFATDLQELQFINDGGELRLNIASGEAWTAETDADWCMISPATGEGSVQCVVRADSSYLYKNRTGVIRFYTAGRTYEVVVNQFGYDPIIHFSQEELSVPSYATPDRAYVEVETSSNVPFKVSIPEDSQKWLSLEGADTYEPSTTVPRKQKFRFRFKTYVLSEENRLAEVLFTHTGGGVPLVKKVRVIQEHAPLIIPSREGDSLALLAIARTFQSASDWQTSRPITHWDDVVTEERTYRYRNKGIDKDSTEIRVTGVRYIMMDTKESIPYQVKFLTELETFIAIGNSNKVLKNIELGTELTTLKKLKSLAITGYGLASLPAELAGMDSLEELDLGGNNLLRLPIEIMQSMKSLKYIDFRGNRVREGIFNLQNDIPNSYTATTIGLGGELPRTLFLMRNLEYVYLSYNYFTGGIPDMEGMAEVLPNLKVLALNLNRLTGKLPDWLLNHKRLACWDPFVLLFSQEGYDVAGKLAGFSNAPVKISDLKNPECPDWKDEEMTIALRLPPLSGKDLKTEIPLHGHWRYYQMLTNSKKANYGFNSK